MSVPDTVVLPQLTSKSESRFLTVTGTWSAARANAKKEKAATVFILSWFWCFCDGLKVEGKTGRRRVHWRSLSCSFSKREDVAH